MKLTNVGCVGCNVTPLCRRSPRVGGVGRVRVISCLSYVCAAPKVWFFEPFWSEIGDRF